jgi:hypothetical protein
VPYFWKLEPMVETMTSGRHRGWCGEKSAARNDMVFEPYPGKSPEIRVTPGTPRIHHLKSHPTPSRTDEVMIRRAVVNSREIDIELRLERIDRNSELLDSQLIKVKTVIGDLYNAERTGTVRHRWSSVFEALFWPAENTRQTCRRFSRRPWFLDNEHRLVFQGSQREFQ